MHPSILIKTSSEEFQPLDAEDKPKVRLESVCRLLASSKNAAEKDLQIAAVLEELTLTMGSEYD